MDILDSINKTQSRQEVIKKLIEAFTPYATELINSGADFSYMNMYADNFKDQLVKHTNFLEEDIFFILNEACDLSWRNKISQ